MLPAFALARPTSLAEALAALSPDHIPYCGGTELLLAMKSGLLRPSALVDLKRVPDLRGISHQGDRVVIGAATSHAELASTTVVRQNVGLVAEVTARIGNARVRATGTVGGNLCFAEPRSDLTTVLIALDATVTLAGPDGGRELPVADFLDGPYSTVLRPGELLVSVAIPVRPDIRAVYLKFQTAERPTVGVALVAPTGLGARLVVGAVGDTPIAHEFPGIGDIDPDAVAADIDPVPDLFGSVRYKRHVAAVYIARAVEALRADTPGGAR